MSLTDHSASDLMRLLRARKLSASDIMADYLDRIARLNPGINALVSLIDPDEAMRRARAADKEEPKGWMHGLPAAPKDLVATKGLRTTWGSPLFADHVPGADDLVAARQRAAGAIFIGKTNTPEWGHGSHSFNPVHGTTLNPYDRTRGAGGSSGGAAAALATRLLAVADGSDMMGSLRNPAAFCNVYGFRPTWGLVPQDAEGDTYLHTLSTEGPMARTIEDLARLLETLCGPNPEAPFGRAAESFADRLDRDVKGLRIGWLGDWGGAYPLEAGILDQCLAGARVLEDMGAIVEPVAPPYPAERLWHAWITLRAMLNAGSMKALHSDPAKRAKIKPETLWEIEQGQSLSTAAVYEASTIRSRWYAHAAKLFRTYDALIMPAAQVWPFPADWRWPREVAGRTMDTYHRWMEVVVPVSLIGLPSLCLPVGFGAGGLPMGMQLIGPTGSDANILSIGQAYHRATDWPGRRPPA
ncbi:amidase [Frigidibacter sp. SD6-1]|uniref:amidase n=1 Tax=Frigidibacter sp. SD6-1 TaxID=3032581 RepID=UPI0024DF48B5|nr:amidase [Frigidibacter sp. SD6-1]